MTHGTITGYYKHLCRCDECRTAATEYNRQWRKSRPSLAADDPRHGTLNAYSNYHCRCDACRRSNADYWRTLRAARREKLRT